MKGWKTRREEVQSSLCFYSCVLADMDMWILCSTLLKIIYATHRAPTRKGKHHYTLHARRFLCGCIVLFLLHYFWYFVKSDAVCRLYLYEQLK